MKYFTVMLGIALITVSCESALSPEFEQSEKHQFKSFVGERQLNQSQTQSDWELQENEVTVPLLSVHFIDKQTGWTVGLRSNRFGPGTFQGTENGGNSWDQIQIDTPRTLRSVLFIDRQTGWVLRDSVAILHTDNGGESWRQQYNDSGNLHDIHVIDSPNGLQGWATGEKGRILHTTNGGESWNEQESGVSKTSSLYSVHFTDTDHGWVVGSDGIILHTADGGMNWNAQTSGVTASLRSVSFTSGPDGIRGWAAGDDGTILFTEDGGENWQFQVSGTENVLNSVHFVDAQTGWAVGGDTYETTILHTTDGGITWQAQESGANSILFSVYFLDKYTGWAVGNHGTILHYKHAPAGNPVVEIPEKGLEMLVSRVNEFEDSGMLNRPQAKGLLAKLIAASHQISRNNFTPARNQINAFIHQVENFQINSILRDEEAGNLIILAEHTLQTFVAHDHNYPDRIVHANGGLKNNKLPAVPVN